MSDLAPGPASPPRSPDAPLRLLFAQRGGDCARGAGSVYEAYQRLRARGVCVSLDVVGEIGASGAPPALPGVRDHGAVEIARLVELCGQCDVVVARAADHEGAESSGRFDVWHLAALACADARSTPVGSAGLEHALATAAAEPATTPVEWGPIAERVRARYLVPAGGPPLREPSPSRYLPIRGAHARALLVLCLLLRIVSLVRPCLSDDEATYAVVAREMVHGKALYRDVVDHKPPAIYLLNAATQAIGGPTGGMVLLHALLIVVVWATALLLASIVRRHRLATRAGPALAALLYVVFTTTLVDADSLAANCELFMMLPLVGSVALFLRAIADPHPRRELGVLLGAGVLVGLGMLCKYQAGVQLPVYGLAWLFARRHTPVRGVLGLVLLALGVALPLAAAAGWLAAIGAAPAAWFWFRFNFAYISEGSTSDMLVRMAVRGGFVIVAAAPLYLLAAVTILRRGGARRLLVFWIVLGWAAVSAAATMVGGRFFGHYFHQLTAPLCVLAAPAALLAWEHRRRLFVGALAVPALAFFALAAAHDWLMTQAGEPDPDYASVVAWLDGHSARSESLCVWGNSPVLYFEAERPLGCRFVFSNYLTGMSPATASQTDPRVDASPNIVPQAWDMLEADLAARRPLWIVDGSPGNVAFYGKWPPDRFPRLAAILAADYEAEAEIAGMRIFRRRAAPIGR